MKTLLIISSFILSAIHINAQLFSGSKDVPMLLDMNGAFIKPLEIKTASLQVSAVQNVPEIKASSILINTKLPIDSGKKTIKSFKEIVPAATVTSTTIYVIPGASSPVQFTSLQANIGIKNDLNITFNLELYKAEVKNGLRSFAIPVGSNGNTAVNIPIQIINPIHVPVGGAAGKGPDYRFTKIIFTNGYLQPGEYILIDKSSLSVDGSKLVCAAFTIR